MTDRHAYCSTIVFINTATLFVVVVIVLSHAFTHN